MFNQSDKDDLELKNSKLNWWKYLLKFKIIIFKWYFDDENDRSIGYHDIESDWDVCMYKNMPDSS